MLAMHFAVTVNINFVMRTMLRIFHICLECGKTFAVYGVLQRFATRESECAVKDNGQRKQIGPSGSFREYP